MSKPETWLEAWRRSVTPGRDEAAEEGWQIPAIERAGFRAGYLAAQSTQEAVIRAAKGQAWGEGYERAMNDRDASDWASAPDTPNPYAEPKEST